MAIKRELVTDGLFVSEKVAISADDCSPEAEDEFDRFFESMAPEGIFEDRESLATSILNNDKSTDFQKEYANRALSRLNLARKYLEDGNCKDLLLNAVLMAENLMRAQVIHIPKKIKKSSSKKATDAKYSPGRENYRVALGLAEKLWRNGDERKHNKMLEHIVGKDGTEPGTAKEFYYLSKFDANCGYTSNGLLSKLKELAYKINKNLVYGLKKMT